MAESLPKYTFAALLNDQFGRIDGLVDIGLAGFGYVGDFGIVVRVEDFDSAVGLGVDEFASDGTLLQHFAVHGPLHSPWGLAQAPANFGPMSNAILVSNNIPRGRINAFDPVTGTFLGPLRDATGQPIEIDDIWGIMFGQGAATGQTNQLFFTAGPNNYSNGLFGVITAN